MAILALGLTPTPQGSAQTLRALPAPPVAERGVDSTIQVLTDRGGLHVDVREAQPADVLQTLGARTGVAVTVEGELPGRITRVFTVASVEAAVREVVRGYQAVLVFENDRAIRVIALGNAPGDGGPASPSPTVAAAQPEAGQARAATDETAPTRIPTKCGPRTMPPATAERPSAIRLRRSGGRPPAIPTPPRARPGPRRPGHGTRVVRMRPPTRRAQAASRHLAPS